MILGDLTRFGKNQGTVVQETSVKKEVGPQQFGPKITTPLDVNSWLDSGEWVEVSSSNIAAIRYDKDKKELFVRLGSGHLVRYQNCDVSRARDLFLAPSVGVALDRTVKKAGLPFNYVRT